MQTSTLVVIRHKGRPRSKQHYDRRVTVTINVALAATRFEFEPYMAKDDS